MSTPSSRNIPTLPDLPLPADTANLRQGPDVNPNLLAFLPLIGVWRGEGVGRNQTGDYPFGQQVTVSHNGGNYLSWESRSWVLDAAGSYLHPDLREVGFWRFTHNLAHQESDGETIELLLTHSTGVIELFYGRPLTQSSWELSTDVVIRSQSGAHVGGAKRLYGIVEGDLAYVEERAIADGPLAPHVSAKLTRYIG